MTGLVRASVATTAAMTKIPARTIYRWIQEERITVWDGENLEALVDVHEVEATRRLINTTRRERMRAHNPRSGTSGTPTVTT